MSRSVISLRAHLLFMSHRFLQSITDWTQTAAAASNRTKNPSYCCCLLPPHYAIVPGPQTPAAAQRRVSKSLCFQSQTRAAELGQQPGPVCSLLPTRRPANSHTFTIDVWLHVTTRPTRLSPCLEPAPPPCTAAASIAWSRQCQWERCPSVRWRGPAWAQHQPGWLNSEIRSLYCCSPLVTSLDASEGWETHSETKLILCLPLLLPLLYKHWFFIAVVCWSDRWSVLYIVTFQGLHHHHHGRAAAEVQGRVQHLLRQVPQAAQRPGPGQQEVRSSGE